VETLLALEPRVAGDEVAEPRANFASSPRGAHPDACALGCETYDTKSYHTFYCFPNSGSVVCY
jgi:hypothetical protein